MSGGMDCGDVDFVGVEGFKALFALFLFGEEGGGVCHGYNSLPCSLQYVSVCGVGGGRTEDRLLFF